MNRSNYNNFLLTLTKFATGFILFVLFFLLSVIFWKGIKAINPEFILTSSKNFGSDGGIFYQIIGTLLLVTFAAVISFPIALGTAIFKSEYLSNSKFKKLLEVLIYGLNGIPSIIFGIFGLILFVNILNTGISWFVGSIILAFMILPTIVLSTYQSLNSIPRIYKENAQALGLNKWQVITSVLLPQGIGGAITGLLIGLARAAGETAPIMFIATAYSGVEVPGSFFEPVTALPTHILALAQQATNPQALQNAWGASVVLISLIMIFSISGLYTRIKLTTISKR
ncbi:MAG: phosphate ABC transporter permease PstA [Thermodesulfobacteriota bacterium]